MISKPEANCPLCGSKYNVFDAVDVSRYAQTVTYYAECECGAANLTVKGGKVIEITRRDPIEVPDYYDEPIISQEDPDYMALYTERG